MESLNNPPHVAKQATPHGTLLEQLLDPSQLKTEREWAACKEIKELRAKLEALEPVSYPVRTGSVDGRLANRRYQDGDALPSVGSYCLVSGPHCDIESDQHRAYSWRKVVGLADRFICLQTRDCWPTVEPLDVQWFAEIPHPVAAGAVEQPVIIKDTP